MSETKTVLGRVFTWGKHYQNVFSCELKSGQVLALFVCNHNPLEHRHCADLHRENDNEIASGYGHPAAKNRSPCLDAMRSTWSQANDRARNGRWL